MKKNKYALQKQKKFIGLAVVTICFMAWYLIWRALFTFPDVKEYGWFSFVLALMLWIAEAASAVEAFMHCIDLSHKVEPEMPKIPDEWFPDVDVFIATHNEEENILYKTANACTYLKYPDKSKVHVYICDDGNRPWVKELAEKIGVGYFGLANNKEAKAGNLNNALKKTNSPLIATFDADMIPTSDFLLETVPYFFLPKMEKNEAGEWVEKEVEDEIQIGFIQTPQSFYNPDLFQYNLFSEQRVPNEQDYFFRQVNIGRNNSNAPIYAGSNTVISRKALEEVGGIATGTITEDFETGLLIEAKGYQCYAVDKTLAKGLAPTTIGALIKQRERWARGCIHSLRRHHIVLNRSIPFKMKVAYLVCRSYWDSFVRRFVYILSPILFILFGIPAVVCDLKGLLLVWLPAYVLHSITLKVCSGNIRNTRLSNIIDTILFPYLMVPIIAEELHIHKDKFEVTNKSKENVSDTDKLLAIPHVFLLVLSVIALCISARDILVYQAFGACILIYWLVVNIGSLIMASFFMFGRKNYRNSERFYGNLPITIITDDDKYTTVTEDFSEGGMSAYIPKAVYISQDDEVLVNIRDKGYEAELKVKVATVISVKGKGHKYCFQILDMDEKNKSRYFQMIYDREHSLPQTISKKSSVYGDISANIVQRMNKSTPLTRKLVRMEVDREYPLSTGEIILLENFNFEYVKISGKFKALDEIEIIIKPGIVMKCRRNAVEEKEATEVKDKDDVSKTGKDLMTEFEKIYEVVNIEELLDIREFEEVISEWDVYDD